MLQLYSSLVRPSKLEYCIRLYYENATHQLRNVIKAQKETLQKRKKNMYGNARHNCTKAHNTCSYLFNVK